MSPANQNRTDRRANHSTETGCGGQPTKTLCAIVRVARIGDVGLDDADRAAAKSLDDAR